MMTRAIIGVRKPHIGTCKFDVHMIVANHRKNWIGCTCRKERRKGVDKRNEPCTCHTNSHIDHVQLTDSDLKIAVWKLLAKDSTFGRAAHIRLKRDNALILSAEALQGIAVGIPNCNLLHAFPSSSPFAAS